MTDRNIYLQLAAPEEAVQRAKDRLDRDALLAVETVPSHLAAGRVLAAPVTARCSSPTYHSAAMDGIAVLAEDTFPAREDNPLALAPEQYVAVNTGHPMPEGRDAVIMIEEVQVREDGCAVIEAPVPPWRHVRRIGEDIVATELLLPRHRRLTPYDAGALLSAGIWEVKVFEPVRILFIPTGDEVLDFCERPEPGPGQVIESNSQILANLAPAWGAEVEVSATVRDDEKLLAQAVREGLEDNHVVIVGAGSSAGSRDFTRAVMESVGEVLVHGIQAMPGKPTLVGIAQGKLLLGAPGYPVSAVVCFEEVLAPLVCWLQRRARPQRPTASVTLTRRTPSRLGLEEMVRLAVGRVGARHVATPLSRGAGMITTMTGAQAVCRIGPESEGLDAGERVTAELLVDEEELSRVLVHVGSHDNTLDLLADELMLADPPLRLVSSHVGSLAGLTALAQGGALFAGAHLFDPDSGDFNFPFIAKYLKNVEVQAVNLAIRHQGLMVRPGNPLSIGGVADLSRPGVRFINRQSGAGTRILLDHSLRQAGIKPEDVTGYEREEYTHMAVAVNVASGAADCGLGVQAAANALGLDFVPLARERYDLVVPAAHMADWRIKAMLAVVRDPAFQQRVEALGGYETALSGRVMQPGDGLGETG
ncbi:MAG: molybdopterin biosynthesis protein [Desulfovibrionaceae bacterium]